MIHGLFGASGNWHTLAKKKFGLYFKTYTIDLRNHGKSPHSLDGTYADMAEDVLELMEDEGLEHAHILGHSMGGKLAMHLALEHPSKVDKLIVADIAPRAYPRSHDTIFKAFKSVDLPQMTSREEVDEVMKLTIPNQGIRQFLLKNLVRRGNKFKWAVNLPSIEHNYEELGSVIEAWEVFEGDALFIRGEKSNYVLDSDFLDIRALFPFAVMETIPNATHWLHAETPDAFAEICLKFLR